MDNYDDYDFVIVDEKNFFQKIKEDTKKEVKKICSLDWTQRKYAAEDYNRNHLDHDVYY